jgi:hypothetical protein
MKGIDPSGLEARRVGLRGASKNQISCNVACGTSRHSPRRNISGRYWGHSGHWSAPARYGYDANDPQRTLHPCAIGLSLGRYRDQK